MPTAVCALIENLNDIDADVLFVKTVDNVCPDHLKADTVTYKKVLAGLLVTLQERAFAYLEELDMGNVSEERLREMLQFVEQDLHCHSDAAQALDGLELLDYLYCRLNRPMRVCGMVRNVGEPGGGPFLAHNPDGSVSLQILESSQIDMSDPAKKALFEKGTHFNPVATTTARNSTSPTSSIPPRASSQRNQRTVANFSPSNSPDCGTAR